MHFPGMIGMPRRSLNYPYLTYTQEGVLLWRGVLIRVCSHTRSAGERGVFLSF